MATEGVKLEQNNKSKFGALRLTIALVLAASCSSGSPIPLRLSVSEHVAVTPSPSRYVAVVYAFQQLFNFFNGVELRA
jgi:hypothetical protein